MAKKQILASILLITTPLLVVFIVGEVTLRMFMASNRATASAIPLKIFEESETYAWKHAPGSIDYHGYGDPTPEIKINSLGFRDWEIGMDDTRILVLGDSFTFGMGVNHEEIFTEVMESKLYKGTKARTAFVNAGAIGYTLDNQYLLLKEKMDLVSPSTVIVAFFTGNDVTEFRRHVWETDKNGIPTKLTDVKHFVDDENRLRSMEETEPISYFWHFISKRVNVLLKKYGVIESNKPTLTWPAFLDPDDPHGDPRLPDFWGKIDLLLGTMKKELDEQNIELLVVAIPMDVQTSKKYWNKYAEMYFDEDAYEKARPQAKLKELTDKHNINYLDLLPAFKKIEESNEKPVLYYELLDPHWTPKGHEAAANEILNHLNYE